jgi:hypothetical protein
MKKLPAKIGFLILGAVLGSTAWTASARSETSYSAKGLPFAAFRLFPVLDVTGSYDDNVYKTNTGEIDDFLVTISPGAVLSSTWGRHEINLRAGADITRYNDRKSENTTDWHVNADGRLDATHNVTITAVAGFSKEHEPRFSPDAFNFDLDPIEYDLLELGAEVAYHPGRMAVTVGGDFRRYDFDDVRVLGAVPGVFFRDQDDRDRREYEVHGELAYEFSPGYAAFVSAAYNEHNFVSPFDRSGINRDSDGYNVNGGLSVAITSLVSAKVFLGYLSQDYDSPLLGTLTGLNFGAEIEWNVTPLMHVTIGASRELADTTLALSSTSDDRNFSVDVDYEVLRNFIASANFDFTHSAFAGIARDDKNYQIGVGGRYLLNRYVNVTGEYAHQTRNSNIAGLDFDANIVSLTLRLQM